MIFKTQEGGFTLALVHVNRAYDITQHPGAQQTVPGTTKTSTVLPITNREADKSLSQG